MHSMICYDVYTTSKGQMNWIESSRNNARKKAEVEAAQQAEARKLAVEALEPFERKRKIAEKFLTQFLPIITDLQRELRKEGFGLGLKIYEGYEYREIPIECGSFGKDAVYISCIRNDSDTGQSWTEFYSLAVNLGELGYLSLVPVGQEEHSLGLYCSIQMPINPISYAGRYVSNSHDSKQIATALQELIGKSIEIVEGRKLRP